MKYSGSTSFIPAPFTTKNGKFECDMFQGNPSDYLLQELKSLFSNRNQNN